MINRRSLEVQGMVRGQVASPLGAMATLSGLGGLSGCPLEVVRALEGLGWNVQRLGTLHDVEDRLGKPIDVQVLLGMIEVSHAAAEVAWRIEGSTSSAELLVAHEQRCLQEKLNEWRKFAQAKLAEKVPALGTAKSRLNEPGENQALGDSG